MSKTGKIWIFCCGEVGEPQYFQDFKNEYKSYRIKVLEIARQAPWQMFETMKKFQQENEKYDTEDDEIWCVFDIDDFLSQNNGKFMKGIRSARELKINLAWSNECFELWFLMHFEYPLEIVGRDMYNKKLKKHFSDMGITYKKNMPGIYNLLRNNLDTAQENGKKLLKTNSSIINNPSSTVHLLIERIFSYL